MITVGIIGPLTPRGEGNHAIEFLENVIEGIHAAGLLIAEGFAPFCPHLDYQYLLADFHFTDAQLKAVSMEWIGRCDVILALHGWRESKGAIAEYTLACQKDIPVVEGINELLKMFPNGASRLVG